MGVFQRAHDIVEAKTNKALDAAEKPDEMLDLSYEKMLEQITQVRRALVDIAASRSASSCKRPSCSQSVDHLQDQAKAALAPEPGGPGQRGALPQGGGPGPDRRPWSPSTSSWPSRRRSSPRPCQALQERVNAFRTQKETLKAQYTAAKAVSSVNESVAGISKSLGTRGPPFSGPRTRSPPCRPTPGPSMSCSSRACSRMWAAGTDDIQKELDQVGQHAQVDEELAALKAQVATPPTLGAGEGHEGESPGA